MHRIHTKLRVRAHRGHLAPSFDRPIYVGAAEETPDLPYLFGAHQNTAVVYIIYNIYNIYIHLVCIFTANE